MEKEMNRRLDWQQEIVYSRKIDVVILTDV